MIDQADCKKIGARTAPPIRSGQREAVSHWAAGRRDHPAFDQVVARAEADGAEIGLTFALGHQQQRGDDVREETH